MNYQEQRTLTEIAQITGLPIASLLWLVRKEKIPATKEPPSTRGNPPWLTTLADVKATIDTKVYQPKVAPTWPAVDKVTQNC